jgi:aryl-alcohol dehydrogenase-like predicted oxidoreductase
MRPAAPLLDTTIPQTGLRCSRFIFGTASLFNAGNTRSRRHLLDSAVASGITHFDTAPYYGFGMAERDLAPVLKANPGCTFTTKVGLYSPGGESQGALAILGRKAAGKLVASLSRPVVDFSLQRAQRALDGSLRRTGRETVDLYMLHEAQVDLVNTDEWLSWLQACVRGGKIRHFGLALTGDRLEPFLQAGSELAGVVQIPDSLDGREADVVRRYGRAMQITYGYVSDARRRGSQRSAADILSQALARNREGAIIVSTTRADRMSQYTRVLEGVA